jgi:hypothetical protein
MAIVQIDESVIIDLRAELLALKAMVTHSAQIVAIVMAEEMDPKAFLGSMHRSVTMLVRSDDFEGATEIIRAKALSEIERIFDAIAKVNNAGSSKGH